MQIILSLTFSGQLCEMLFEFDDFEVIPFYLLGYWKATEVSDMRKLHREGVRLRITCVDDCGRVVSRNPVRAGVTVPQPLYDGIKSIEELSELFAEGLGCVLVAMEEQHEVRTEERIPVGEASEGADLDDDSCGEGSAPSESGSVGDCLE